MNQLKICRFFFCKAKNFSSKHKLCYYEILGVQQGEDIKAIKKSFMKLAKKYHPDVNKDELS